MPGDTVYVGANTLRPGGLGNEEGSRLTAFRLHVSDAGRAKAGIYVPVDSDQDCVTRALTHGLGLPYPKVHDMVDEAAKEYGTTAETGAHGVVAAKILHGVGGWRSYERHELTSSHPRLTVEDLRLPLSQHSVLIVETRRVPATPDAQGTLTLIFHLTAVVDDRVFDIASMGAGGYARTDRVENVWGKP
jgi:hypothetical protein